MKHQRPIGSAAALAIISLFWIGCGGGGAPGAVTTEEGETAQTTQALGVSVTSMSALSLPDAPISERLVAPTAVIAFSPQQPVVGDLIVLDATATDSTVAGFPLFYLWNILSKPEGSTAWLGHQSGPLTFFAPDVPGDYEIHLGANHDIAVGLSTTTITVGPGTGSPPSEMPQRLGFAESMSFPTAVGEFSPASPTVGDVVELDGTGSVPSAPRYPLYFDWQILSRPAGSIAAVDDRSAAATWFMPDVPGDYIVFFAVTHDGTMAMAMGTITVTQEAP